MGEQKEKGEQRWDGMNEKENSGTESPNLYSDCIIYIGVKEGICMRIKGNPHPYCEPTPRS